MSAPIFYSASPDLALAAAAAQGTFKYFWRELSWERRRIVPAFHLAAVKATFTDGKATEHMWVDDLTFDGRVIRGVLCNEPHEVSTVHEGDEVEIPFAAPRDAARRPGDAAIASELDDWMLGGSGVLGGFSVQVLRAEMGAAERAGHDEAWGLTFPDPAQVAVPPTGDDHPMALNAVPKLLEFLQANPDASAPDEDGWTMLHHEALAGNACVVQALVSRGADKAARTGQGDTALDLARLLGWPAVEALLV